jgi:predicted Zn-dependent protease
MQQRSIFLWTLAATLALVPVGFADVKPPATDTKIDQSKPPKNEKHDVSKIGDRDVDGKVNFYSIEKEIGLGKQLSQEIERNAKIIDDPVIAEYVNRVGQNLVRNSDARVPFTIKVIDAPEVNAFALPGGFFYVNSGLIALAETESELAGVMAHEIAHVTARHGTRQATKGQIANLASIPMAIFLPGGWLGYGIYQGLNFAIPMTFLKFGRSAESEADFLGLQYLYKTGYDPTSMVTFFERMQAQQKRKQGGGIAAAFRSHPPTAKRIVAISKHMGTILPAKPEYAVSTSEFDTVRARLVKMTQRDRREESDPDRPRLRRSAPSDRIDPSGGEDGGDVDIEDERPTLKRRVLTENSTASTPGA